ncbi:outer membrane protein [Fontimonas thermophila]|uniref:Outer membrane protein n=1 Tax=Fontimonas thermophila TaxID=1076937 RepID=A0A1I2HCC0_9GAMM|nr:TolC family outer membrane protein [Fontimonas thermophila]SFF27198.1 outer membrane protein [Fontimonas thermophila]
MICAARLSPTAVALLAVLAASPAAAMTLSEAYGRAAGHDPAIAVSQAQYAAARQSGAIERGTLLPTVSAGGHYGYARTQSDGVFGRSQDRYPSWGAQVTARQPLFRLDWFARRERARALDDQAETAFRDREQQTLVRVAERYFAVLVAQDQLAQAEAEAAAVRESLEDTRKRYAVELVPGTDLKEAQARDDLAQARVLSAQTALETAREALDEITGNGHVALPVLPEDVVFPPLQPADAEQWVEAARAQSPRIALAAQALRIAEADRERARSAAMPALDLVASAGREDTSEFDFGQRTDDARIGVELSVPIYAGGINHAAWQQAIANAQAAQAELRRVTLETERTTRQLFRQVATAYAEVGAYARALESARAAEAATRAGYDAGTRTITDVLDAKSRVVQAQRDLNGTRYRLLLNLLQLKQLAGELSAQDFAQIDQLLRYPPAR